MYDATLPSNGTGASLDPPSLQRARGLISASFRCKDGETRLHNLRQSGCGKARLPSVFGAPYSDIVAINTSGGLTGGDLFDYALDLGEGVQLRSTTQACEKVYQASSGQACVNNHLKVGDGASLHWIPQETIFYNGGALSRRLNADIASGAELLALEPIAFGRTAMGETRIAGRFKESWRIHRGGALVYAEEASIGPDISSALSGASVLNGATVALSGILVSQNLQAKRDRLRETLTPRDGLIWGSSLRRGVLVFRAAARDTLTFRKWLSEFYFSLTGRVLPRPWNC